MLHAGTVEDVLDLPREHRLTRLYAEALNQLGGWLPDNGVGDTANDLARRLTQMPFFDDVGFYKRAQITANDLQLAGVADFPDIDSLTIFADNLVPHVLHLDGVLHYDREPVLVEAGSTYEIEIRACAVHACELIAAKAGIPPRRLDNWLWNRGQHPPYSERPAHLTQTVFY